MNTWHARVHRTVAFCLAHAPQLDTTSRGGDDRKVEATRCGIGCDGHMDIAPSSSRTSHLIAPSQILQASEASVLPVSGVANTATGLAAPLAAAPAAASAPVSLLDGMRRRVAQNGVPRTVALCLRAKSAHSTLQHAILCQRLTLALADDRTPSSPLHPLATAQSDACHVYRGIRPLTPAAFLTYHDALRQLRRGIAEAGTTLAGTYGFMQQSAACERALQRARSPEDTRAALSAWLNWQWSALPAMQVDPLMRAPQGEEPFGPLRCAYALDEPTFHRDAIVAALEAQR
ncbi:hypothetical protein GCM10027214_06580 [Stenotrophomonas tumulicola]